MLSYRRRMQLAKHCVVREQFVGWDVVCGGSSERSLYMVAERARPPVARDVDAASSRYGARPWYRMGQGEVKREVS